VQPALLLLPCLLPAAACPPSPVWLLLQLPRQSDELQQLFLLVQLYPRV
jgi:hypothetical protein